MNVKKCVRALLCLYLTLIIAMDAVKAQALKVGNTLPPELRNMPLDVINHPQGKETLTLSEYKDKLIILDFWATWCAPCIKSLTKLDTLQKEFGEQLAVIPVTYENADKVLPFLTKRGYQLPSVVGDTMMKKWFPHNSLPHIVWVSSEGKILSTTRAEEANQQNIESVLLKKSIDLRGKIDVDRNRPLFISDNFQDDRKLLSYSILTKGFYAGLPSGNKFKRNAEGELVGRQMTNLPLMRIYSAVAYELFSAMGDSFTAKKIILDVKNKAQIYAFPYEGESEKDNLYSYEMISSSPDSLYWHMLADLNKNLKYTAYIEKRMTDCLALVRTTAFDKISTHGGIPRNTFPRTPSVLTNSPLSGMIKMLNGNTPIDLLVIDETAYTENVDINISSITDLSDLKRQLNHYDLDLLKVRREFNMLVIRDK